MKGLKSLLGVGAVSLCLLGGGCGPESERGSSQGSGKAQDIQISKGDGSFVDLDPNVVSIESGYISHPRVQRYFYQFEIRGDEEISPRFSFVCPQGISICDFDVVGIQKGWGNEMIGFGKGAFNGGIPFEKAREILIDKIGEKKLDDFYVRELSALMTAFSPGEKYSANFEISGRSEFGEKYLFIVGPGEEGDIQRIEIR